MSERTVSFRVSPPVRPAPLYEAAIIFASTSLLFFACLYLLLPLLRLHHISWFTTYNRSRLENAVTPALRKVVGQDASLFPSADQGYPVGIIARIGK
jgi:hypothetical protein